MPNETHTPGFALDTVVNEAFETVIVGDTWMVDVTYEDQFKTHFEIEMLSELNNGVFNVHFHGDHGDIVKIVLS